MRRTLSILMIFALLSSISVGASERSLSVVSPAPETGMLGKSLSNEVRAAIDRGLDWLAANQKENGAWSNEDFPALTALALQAFLGGTHPAKKEVTDRAVKYITSCAREDGGIYRTVEGKKGGGLSNYNTAICMTALHATGNKALTPIVLKARKFMAGAQHLGGDIYSGGFGYDASTKRAYTDLLNTMYSVEAMALTADAEDLRPGNEKRVDLDYRETVKFIESLQNKFDAGTNNAGGFFYNPTDPKAGTVTNEAAVVYFRSYGSITYAGLLTLIYADVSRDDPRVRSAFDWASRHWSLDENPGMGDEGMYFFFNVLAKSLTAYGADLVPVKPGKTLNWRSDLAEKLVGIQKVDEKTGRGYWDNPNGRFWENDPVLVTSYALIALELIDN